MKSGTVHKNTEDYPPSCLSKAKSLKKKGKALVLMSAALLLLSSCSLFGEHLAFFNWGEYVNEDVLAESPVPVEMQNFEDNVEMLTKLTTTSYDVVVPSDYAIEELASEGKLEELNLSKFKNYSVSRLEESYREALDGLKQDTLEVQEDGSKKVVRSGFDLLKYAVPYTYGEIGIIYDKTKVSEEELDRYGWDIFKTKRKDGSQRRIVFYNESRHVLSMALLATGHGFTDPTDEEIDDAMDWLKSVKYSGNDFGVETTEILEDGPAHRFDLCLDYSGDAFYCMNNDLQKDENGNSTLGFYIPKTNEAGYRTCIFTDCFVIMKDSDKKDEAYSFIDYMVGADNEARNMMTIGYQTPYQDSLDLLIGEPSSDKTDESREADGAFNKIKDVYAREVGDGDRFYRFDNALKNRFEELFTLLKTE
jgi:spermidine/putrescine transport system substrate-binding protein